VRITLKHTGNWQQVGMMVSGMARRNYQLFFDQEFRRLVDEYLKRIKNHISAQDLGWVPLAESTVLRKRDSKAWIDSGYFRDHLRITEKKMGMLRRWFVGAVKGDIHEPSEMPMSVLAFMLEYGYRNIPARPLFGPSLEHLVAEWQSRFANMQLRAINKMRVGV